MNGACEAAGGAESMTGLMVMARLSSALSVSAEYQ
jgi:hypothetical protein